MSDIDSAKTALVAVICEAVKLGVDLNTLKNNASAGIMGNGVYSPGGGSSSKADDVLMACIDEAQNSLATIK